MSILKKSITKDLIVVKMRAVLGIGFMFFLIKGLLWLSVAAFLALNV